MYQHIVSAIDLNEPSDAVLSRSLQMRDLSDADLTVLSVLPDIQALVTGFDVPFSKDVERSMIQEGSRKLKAHLAKRIPLRKADAETYEQRCIVGSAETSITAYARRVSGDLIVVGAHDRHGLEYFLGTTASAVLYRANCDVLGVRDHTNVQPYRNVLIAIDGGSQSREILARAASLLSGDMERCVINVIRPLLLDYPGSEFSQPPEFEGEQLNLWREHIRSLVSSSGLGNAKVRFEIGKPSMALKSVAASEQADLLVVGSGDPHGPGWMIGSTTHNVLHGVDCDVLVIRQQHDSSAS